MLAIDDTAMAGLALHLARNANQLAEKVVVYTNGNKEVEKEIKDAIGACKEGSKTRRCVSVEGRKIVRLVKVGDGSEVEVHLEGSEVRMEGFLAHKTKTKL